ncbi:MAG: ABC transporter permease [Actinobacteria bacterium]|nr:ABC transporter permease [Actinomycetota bacterium]
MVTRQRVLAIVSRHWYVLLRSPQRWFDVLIWPLLDTVLFGALGVYVAEAGGAGGKGLAFLLAGILLFHVIFQANISVSVGFLEESWSRNLLNIMTTPLTELEYVLGVALFGLGKLLFGVSVVAVTALGFFSFAATDVGWGLVPIMTILLVIGWAISLFVIGLVLRYGPSADILAWGLLFLVMPLSGVFYPTEALPGVLQPVARLLPTTHLFQAARDVLDGRPLPWGEIGYGAAATVVVVAAGLAFVLHMLRVFRQRGYVTRFS